MNIPFLEELLKDNEKRAILVLAVLAAVLIAYLLFVAVPQLRDLILVSSEFVTLEKEMRSTEQEIQKTAYYQKTLNELKEKFSQYQTYLLGHEGEIPVLMEKVSRMARESGVKILGIKPVNVQEGPAEARGALCREISILTVARSGYHELGTFVNHIESADIFLRVADLRLRFNKTSPKKHDVSLSIVSYLFMGGKGGLE